MRLVEAHNTGAAVSEVKRTAPCDVCTKPDMPLAVFIGMDCDLFSVCDDCMERAWEGLRMNKTRKCPLCDFQFFGSDSLEMLGAHQRKEHGPRCENVIGPPVEGVWTRCGKPVAAFSETEQSLCEGCFWESHERTT